MLGARTAGVYIGLESLDRLGLSVGDYIQIDHDERGTCVVRRVQEVAPSADLNLDYVYVDERTADYLNTPASETVTIRRAKHSVDVP